MNTIESETNLNNTISQNIKNGGIICPNMMRNDFNSRIASRTFNIHTTSYTSIPIYFDFTIQNKKQCFQKYNQSKKIHTNHNFIRSGYESL